MDQESNEVVRLALRLLLEGQMRVTKLKSAYNSPNVAHRFLDMKPTYWKSWTGNLLMWSDLALGPSFQVKRWFTGYGALSFQWIQFELVPHDALGLVYFGKVT